MERERKKEGEYNFALTHGEKERRRCILQLRGPENRNFKKEKKGESNALPKRKRKREKEKGGAVSPEKGLCFRAGGQGRGLNPKRGGGKKGEGEVYTNPKKKNFHFSLYKNDLRKKKEQLPSPEEEKKKGKRTLLVRRTKKPSLPPPTSKGEMSGEGGWKNFVQID